MAVMICIAGNSRDPVTRRIKGALIGKPKKFDPSRRGVLKGAAALAATAVAATSIPGVWKAMELDQINDLASRMVSGAVIENQTFFIEDTIVLEDVKGLVMRNCRIVMSIDTPVDRPFLMIKSKVSEVLIDSCHFSRGQIQGGAS